MTNHAGNFWEYAYDPAEQLKVARGFEPGGSTNRVHERYGYEYDPANNLSERTNNLLVQTFVVNNLNQLTTNTRSGTLTVAGVTTSAATNVTVNSVAAILYGDATFARTNVSLVDGTNTFTAVASDAYGRADTNSVSVFLPVTNRFAYDANGNLTNAVGLANSTNLVLEYDDENQLIRVTATNAWRSEFTYDGKFLVRVRKEYKRSGTTWLLTGETRYVYDGMLVVQERDGNNTPILTYTRGNDLSGTMEGAGGIGGLLALTENSTLNSGSSQPASAIYHSDGNGNITALVATNQQIVARYAYDPYGNTLSISGPKAALNRYRFSSREIHDRTGFYSYPFRWYIPELQRWASRDRIGEAGGVNLYVFVLNNPVDYFDPFGLSQADCEKILRCYERTTREMNEAGHRVGWFPPFSSLKYWVPGNGWECVSQSQYVAKQLHQESKDFDDRWTIRTVTSPSGTHTWVEATSLNPSDPHIRLDPWWGKVNVKRPSIPDNPSVNPPISNVTANNIPTVTIPPFPWGRMHP
jgi:RHS repeat-associated protein